MKKLPQNVIIELSWQEAKILRRSYVGWSGDASKQHSTYVNTIEIDPQFGSSIGLHDGQKVISDLNSVYLMINIYTF